MSHLGEFELIGRIAATCHPERSEGSFSDGSGIVGIGDDCAVIPQHSGLDTLVTTDLLIEDRHFLLSDVTPFELGWKSAAVNISDIAAMGGRPVASFLSIALPPSCHPERSEGSWIDEFIRGFNELCGKFGVALLGGDTSASDDKLFINVTVLGECPHGRAVLRTGARPGDLVCVTGCLGDSAAGLRLILGRAASGQQAPPATSILEAAPLRLSSAGEASTAPLRCGQVLPEVLPDVPPDAKKAQNDAGGPSCDTSGSTAEEILIRRHYLPVPRVELGQQLAALTGVHAMMDISDGIASDLRHILNASSTRSDADWARSRFNPDTLPSNMHSTPLYGTSLCKVLTSKLDLAQMPMDGNQVCVLSAEIDLKSLPLSEELRAVCAERGWDAAELAVSGGEDYELLFTVEPGTELPEGCTVIGRIVPGEGGISWLGSDKDFKGFTHF